MGVLIGQIVGAIIGMAIGALVGALVVRFATNIVAKFVPPFGMAYLASFLGAVGTYLVGLILGQAMGISRNDMSGAQYLLLMIVGFFVYAAVLGPLIKHPETGAIGFGKACLVSLVQVITMVVIISIVVLVVTVTIN